jgi:hypothetical protein
MPVTLEVGQSVLDTVTESNAAGAVPVIGADITFTTAEPNIVSVVNHGDGTATWKALAVGVATITNADIKFNLSLTDTITVIPIPPTVISHSFGNPS